ncbi:hypothetical protein CDAR_411021 [Caerostris darwini]|uniref:Uncharacterized protein n=1 Tax=Caerostris darwini TaxID=1538125 RepID=A0AAV4SGS3_9ARAC|nr:hypothetical protein CDAR_411021 [Caerostris darwini]
MLVLLNALSVQGATDRVKSVLSQEEGGSSEGLTIVGHCSRQEVGPPRVKSLRECQPSYLSTVKGFFAGTSEETKKKQIAEEDVTGAAEGDDSGHSPAIVTERGRRVNADNEELQGWRNGLFFLLAAHSRLFRDLECDIIVAFAVGMNLLFGL